VDCSKSNDIFDSPTRETSNNVGGRVLTLVFHALIASNQSGRASTWQQNTSSLLC